MIHVLFWLAAVPWTFLVLHYAFKAVLQRNRLAPTWLGRLLRWPSAIMAFAFMGWPFALARELHYVPRDVIAAPLLAIVLPVGLLSVFIVRHAEGHTRRRL